MYKIRNLFGEWHLTELKSLYSLYLSMLMAKGRLRRVLEASQQIRKYAMKAQQPGAADFTYQFEIDALCKLGMFANAWRQLRRLERNAYGKNIALASKKWRPVELDWFWSYHPHILYFLGRYETARRLLEAAIAKKIARHEDGLSYQLLPYVYKRVVRPRDRQDVTLYHIYRKLGKGLGEWPQWVCFVGGLHPGLFKLAGIEMSALLHDPSLLPQFALAIEKERKKRLTAGISIGERELVDSPKTIKRLQGKFKRMVEHQDLTVARREVQLKELFPELQ